MTQKEEITWFLRQINSTKFTIVFFNYSAKRKWYNIFLLATKFYYWLNNRPKIDHVAFISKWRRGEPYIIEANVTKGMIESNLVERLEHFHGNFYYKTLDYIYDEKIVEKYRKEFLGKPYDVLKAVGSAVDNVKWFTKFVDKIKPKGYFCSYSVIDLIDKISGDAKNIIKKAGGNKFKVDPTEIYEYYKEDLKKIKIIKENKFLKFMKISFTTSLFIIIFWFGYMTGWWITIASKIPEYQELNAFDRQTKENKILQSMANAYREELDDEKKQNVYLSLLVADEWKRYFSFVDMIVFGHSEIESFMRNSLRGKYGIFCDVNKLNLDEGKMEIPLSCVDTNISVNRKNLQSLYGYRLNKDYLIIMACYNVVCSKGQARNVFNFLRSENG